jgi:PAS domain-containing protein
MLRIASRSLTRLTNCVRLPRRTLSRDVEGGRQKNLALILARQFAAMLAMPMFVVDENGRLVFYNEPAEQLTGRTFAETGEMTAREWTSLLSPKTLDGKPVEFEARPTGIALLERRPAHDQFRITGFDGRERVISATTLPLFAREHEFLGVVAIFWEQPD